MCPVTVAEHGGYEHLSAVDSFLLTTDGHDKTSSFVLLIKRRKTATEYVMLYTWHTLVSFTASESFSFFFPVASIINRLHSYLIFLSMFFIRKPQLISDNSCR